MPYCEDCGCSTRNGICGNCQEELYIESFQGEYIDQPLNKEFQEKAAEQSAYLAKRGYDNNW